MSIHSTQTGFESNFLSDEIGLQRNSTLYYYAHTIVVYNIATIHIHVLLDVCVCVCRRAHSVALEQVSRRPLSNVSNILE